MVKPNITGEKQIASILKDMGINFDRKKKLYPAKDSKKYRIPDFYLPKYKLAIEYFGSWDNSLSKTLQDKERARFMEKVGAYEASGVKCVYIYPNQLAVAKEIIQKALRKYEKKSTKNSVNDKIAKSIFIEKKNSESKVATMVKNEKIVFTERKPIKRNVVEKEESVLENKAPSAIYRDTSTLRKIILFCIYGEALLFILILLSIGTLIFQGNPLISPLIDAYEIIYALFVIAGIISIILSAVFAYLNDLSHGFIIVAAILLIFYAGTIFYFGDPFARIITILVTILALIPAEYYMVTSN